LFERSLQMFEEVQKGLNINFSCDVFFYNVFNAPKINLFPFPQSPSSSSLDMI
jgi:hypothetical protein